MAFYGEDTDISKLLNEVKQLFQGEQKLAPPSATSQSPAQNTAPGTYQAPLKGTWYNSGGFDLVSMRPNGRKGHGGVDMRAPTGTPVYPLAPGVVTSVGTDPLGGNVVNVQHADGVRTYYAHLSTAKVFKGDKVDNNTVLGAVGNTGNAVHTVPHLHFQVWKDNQLQNPAQYFSIPAYTNLSADEKKQGPYLSEQAKQEALNFNMKNHVQQKRMALRKATDILLKAAHQYYKLSSD